MARLDMLCAPDARAGGRLYGYGIAEGDPQQFGRGVLNIEFGLVCIPR